MPLALLRHYIAKYVLACALTNKACREGYRAFYIRSPKFSYQMALAKGDGSYGKTINKLAKAHVAVQGRGRVVSMKWPTPRAKSLSVLSYCPPSSLLLQSLHKLRYFTPF